MKHLKLFFALFAMLALGVGNAWGQTKIDVVSAIEFAGVTTNGYTAAGTDYSAVANTTNNTSVTYAMQVFDGKTGAVRGNKSGNANFSCRNTTTCDGYYISKVVLTVTGGTLDGATNNRSVVYFGTSAYANPTTAPTGTSTKSAENATGTTLTWNNTNEEASYFILYNLKTSGTLKGGEVTITWTKKSGGSTPDPGTPVATLNADPKSLDFGTVTQNDDVAAKTFTISGSNLTVGELALTAPSGYTVSPATVAVDGTLANTTVTVTPNTTAVGSFNGNLTITGGGLTSAVNVAISMTVEKAPATPTENVYVKVTETAGITDGEYLIVYEDATSTPKAPVAFNGSLTTLDVACNMMSVTITDNVINGNTEIDEVTFTISAMTDGYAIKSKSGKYIGRTSRSNGMNTSDSEILNIITITDGTIKVAGSGSGASTSLQYYSVSGLERFRYFSSNQKPIALYKKVDPNAVVEPIFTPAAGEYYGTQSVTISCATAGAEVYYTLDGNDPTSASTKYTGAISIASTTTIKAVAIKGENSSAVVSATYTILAPLATMQAIFDKATAVGGTATPVHITMNNWVVTGVKNNNVYVTDGTKGLIIYTASHGFNVGDILSGTVACKVQLYNGSSELTELTSTTEGLTVTTGGAVSPREVTDITTLGGVNTGSVIKVTGPCTVNGTKYYVAGLELYNSLFAYTNPEDGYNYECTGVYLQYNTTKEILPRKAEDLVKIETQQPAGIKFETTEYTANVNEAFTAPTLTNPNGLTVTYSTSDATLATVDATTGEVTIGNKAGKVTITASFAGSDDYVAANASYNITITGPSISEATFVAATDKGNTEQGEGSIAKSPITFACTDGILGNGSEYRLYKDATISFTAENGYAITKVVITSTASGTSKYGPGLLSTENGTYSYSDKTGTWVGEAQTVTFTATAQSRAKLITVYYKTDNRQDAGLVWSTENVSITLGDAFTAPTLSNPNGLTLTCTSDNENLATVTNAGVVTLKSGVTGKATITAKFDGNSNYKDATVTCTITVNPKTEIVVILAQYNGQWYALKNVEETAGKVLAALPVNYIGGKLYNIEDADKATIEWQRASVTDGIIFKNGENYIYGTAGSTDLKLSTTECAWTLDGSTYKIGNRTFIYRAQANGFKNYNAEDNAGTADYSSLPVVTAPVYATGDAYSRSTTAGKFGTICLPFGSTNFTGAEFFECVGKEEGKVYLGSVTTLVAGVPYIFEASAAEVAVYGDGTTAATPSNSNGLHGTFTDDTEVAANDDNHILLNNELRKVAETCWVNAYRAYIVMSEVPTEPVQQMPGRRYIGMSVQGENEATGFENITAPEGKTVKAIVNGQLIIIRDGEMYNAQGQRL